MRTLLIIVITGWVITNFTEEIKSFLDEIDIEKNNHTQETAAIFLPAIAVSVNLDGTLEVVIQDVLFEKEHQAKVLFSPYRKARNRV